MVNIIKIFVEADAFKSGKDLVQMIEQASKNSISHVLDVKEASEDILHFTIQTTSDKIEGLCHRLGDAGLLLRDNAADILMNAASQYSLYREIHLNISIYSSL